MDVGMWAVCDECGQPFQPWGRHDRLCGPCEDVREQEAEQAEADEEGMWLDE